MKTPLRSLKTALTGLLSAFAIAAYADNASSFQPVTTADRTTTNVTDIVWSASSGDAAELYDTVASTVEFDTGDAALSYSPAANDAGTDPASTTVNLQFNAAATAPAVPTGAQTAITVYIVNGVTNYYVYAKGAYGASGAPTAEAGWVEVPTLVPDTTQAVSVQISIDYDQGLARYVIGGVKAGDYYLANTPDGTTVAKKINSLNFAGSGVLSSTITTKAKAAYAILDEGTSPATTTYYDTLAAAEAGYASATTPTLKSVAASSPYAETPVTFTVNFVDENGTTVLATQTLAYGAPVAYAGQNSPSKADSGSNTYTWTGWNDGTTDYGTSDSLPIATADATYTATYKTWTMITPPSAAQNLVYNGATQDGIEDNAAYTRGDAYSAKNVGTYTASVALADKANTVWSDTKTTVDKTYTWSIAAKTLGLSWSNTTLTYNGSSQAPTATLTGVEGSDDVTVAVSGDRTDVGTYNATADSLGGADAGNYALPALKTQQFSIAKKALAVTANAKTITYGDAPANDGVTYSGFVAGEDENNLSGTLAYAYDYTQYGNVGNYTITPSGLTSSNYDITFNAGTLQVTQKEVGLTWDDNTFAYDGHAHPAATATGLVNGDQIDVTVSGTETDVGSYTATASGLTGTQAANYTLPAANTQAFEITGAALANFAVTLADWTYGSTAATPTVSGNDGNGTVTITYSADGTTFSAAVPTAAGSYTVKAEVPAAGNYAAGTATDTFAILPATITVTAEATTQVYGAQPSSIAYTVSGLVNGEPEGNAGLSGALSFDQSAGAGAAGRTYPDVDAYPITAGDLVIGSGGNYTLGSIVTAGVSYTVTPAALAVKAEDASVPHGTAPANLTFASPAYTVTGLVNGDTEASVFGANAISVSSPSYVQTASLSDTFPIIPAYTYNGYNYTVTAQNGTLSISSVTFPIEFVNWDNSHIDTVQVEYGDIPSTGASPTRSTDQAYSYQFVGWENAGQQYPVGTALPAATAAATYTAYYDGTAVPYTVTFEDYDGSLIVAQTVGYGGYPTAPTGLTRASDNVYSYSFAGWLDSNNNSVIPNTVAVTGNVTYTADYTPTFVEYRITFLDGDPATGNGTILWYNDYHYNDVPAFGGTPNPPIRVSTSLSWYWRFNDRWLWEYDNQYYPANSLLSVTSQGKYYADFRKVWIKGIVPTVLTNTTTIANYRTVTGNSAAVTYRLADSDAFTSEPSVTSTPAGAANGTLTIADLAWNAKQDWTITTSVTEDEQTLSETLAGSLYAKDKTAWFSEETLGTVTGFGDDITEGIAPAAASAAGQQVRINTRLDISDSGMDTAPRVGDARGGFAVLQLTGDTAPAYYAYTGDSTLGTEGWVKLSGAAPVAGEHDVLITVDTAENVAYYYVDGASLYIDGETKTYAIPVATGETVSAIGFSNPDGVKSAVVGEYDVPYVAAIGNNGYTTAESAVAAADKTGTNVLELFDDVSGTITLANGESVLIKANGNTAPTVTTSVSGKEVRTSDPVDGVVTYDLVDSTATVIWVVEGRENVTETYAIGATPVYPGEGPAKAADAQYTYEFTGWSPAIAPVAAGGATYTAQFSETLRQYTVTFTWHGGSSEATYDYGTAAANVSLPSDPASYVENGLVYTFTGWPAIADVTGNASYAAIYDEGAAVKATVLSVADNGDGTVTTNLVASYASIVDAIATAEDGNIVQLVADETIAATRTANADRIVVTQDITIDFGANTLSVPGELEPSSNWAALYIEGDVTVTGTTGGIDCLDKETPDADGAVTGVYAFNVLNGGSLTIDGGVYHGGGTIAQASLGTVTVNGGTFTATPFSDPYGMNFVFNCKDSPYQAGTAGVAINGGTFVGFDPQDCTAEGAGTDFTSEGFVAIEDPTNPGTFVVQPGYNVTFANYDGTVLETQRVPAGDTPVYGGAAPTQASTASAVYAFSGWSPAIVAAAADTTYTAQFSSIYLDPASLELYPNCSNYVQVVGAPEGSTYRFAFAPSTVLGSGGYSSTLGWGKPYAKKPGSGTVTATVSNNNEQVAQFVANVTVKDVVAVVDGVEYATADWATAVSTAIANDQVLEVYYNVANVYLNGGQTLRWKAADNRGQGKATVLAAPATSEAMYKVTSTKDNETGITTAVCSNEGSPNVMYVNADGTTTNYYADLSMTKVGTYKLLRSMSTTRATASASGAVTLDMNGKTLTVTGTDAGIFVYPAIGKVTALTITGDGTVDVTAASGTVPAIWAARKGTVTVENGTFIGAGNAVYVSDTASAIVSNGTFRVTGSDKAYLLNCQDANAGAITVAGGSFEGFDPEHHTADPGVTDYLASGYISCADDPSSGWYTVYEAVTVSFVNEKGAAPADQVIGKGKTATAPAAPAAVTGYTFNGWFAPNAESAFDFATPVTADLTLTADWTVNSHTLAITYVVPEGFTAPAAYSRDYDYDTAYSVSSPVVTGCTPDVATVTGTMGDEDVSVTVTYTADDVTVIWIVNGTSTEETYEYGQTASYKGETPTKAADDNAIYTFTGWDPAPGTVTADATYTAGFKTWTKVAVPTAASGLVYTGSEQTGVAAGTGYTLTGDKATNAGSYTATATLADAANTVWADATEVNAAATADKSIAWSIGKAEIAITVTGTAPASAAYTGSEQTANVAYTATSESALFDAANVVYSGDATVSGTAVGSYPFGLAASQFSYDDANVDATFSVTDASFAITAAKVAVPTAVANLTYDGTEQTGVAAGTGYTLTGNTATDAGDYTATATLAANYEWADENLTGPQTIAWSIAKATVAVAADPKTQVYGASAEELTYTAGNLVSGNSFSGALAREAGDAVGTYPISIGTLSAGDNYTIEFTGANYTITAAKVAVPTAVANLTYDGTEKTGVAEVAGYTLTGNTATDAGSYTAIATLAANYEWDADPATGTKEIAWSIAKRAITVTAADAEKTAGDDDPAFSASVTTGALVDGQTIAYTFARAEGETAGDYTITPTATITASDVNVTANYDITVVTGTLTINEPEAATVIKIALDAPTLDATGVSGKNVTVAADFGSTEISGEVNATATPNGTLGDATAGVATATFPAEWNQGVEWTIADATANSTVAPLTGKTYLKAETAWDMTSASAEGQAVRIQTSIEFDPVGVTQGPTVTADDRGGITVVNGKYAAFNGSTWVELAGATPKAEAVDLLMVADMAAASPTVRYYIDGVALYAGTAANPQYAIPLKTGTAYLTGVAATDTDATVTFTAEYDVPYVAAIGTTGYTNATTAVAAADKTGTAVLELLANVPGEIALTDGQSVQVKLNGFTGPTFSTSETGKQVVDTLDAETGVTTYALAAQTFLIKFVNYDDTVLQSDMLAYGTTPAYTNATPVKPEDAQYTYTFSGWDPATLATVTEAATYKAQFTATAKATGAVSGGVLIKDETLTFTSIEVGNGTVTVTFEAEFVLEDEADTTEIPFGILYKTNLAAESNSKAADAALVTLDEPAQGEEYSTGTAVITLPQGVTDSFFLIGFDSKTEDNANSGD